jgi:hypothetical protein
MTDAVKHVSSFVVHLKFDYRSITFIWTLNLISLVNDTLAAIRRKLQSLDGLKRTAVI